MARPAGTTPLELLRIRQSRQGAVGPVSHNLQPSDGGVTGQEGSRGRELGVRVARLKAARRALG